MNRIKLFEDFNNRIQNISQIIKKSGYVFVKSVKNNPDHDPEEPVRAISIDEDGLVTVDIGGQEYEVDLENVEIAPQVIRESLEKENGPYEEILSYFENLVSDGEIKSRDLNIDLYYVTLSQHNTISYEDIPEDYENSKKAIEITYWGLANTREYIASGQWTRYKGNQKRDLSIIYSSIHRFEKLYEDILIFHNNSTPEFSIMIVFLND